MKLAFKQREVVKRSKLDSLRESGRVPVVCYGGGKKNATFSVSLKDLCDVITSDDIILKAEGDLEDTVIIKSVEYNPLDDTPIHVDFLFVDDKHEIIHDVPIRVVGESPAVKSMGGLLIIASDSISIRALPQDVPGHIDVDVSQLEEIGSHFTASDLKIDSKLTLVTNKDEVLISISAPKEEEEEPTEEISMEDIEVTNKAGIKEKEEGEVEDENK